MSDPTRDLEAEQSKRPATFTPICVDSACAFCEEQPRLRVCEGCDAYGLVTDCGHYAQPRPIAPGRVNGSDLGNNYCGSCADAEEEVEDAGIHCGEETPGPNYEPDPDIDKDDEDRTFAAAEDLLRSAFDAFFGGQDLAEAATAFCRDHADDLGLMGCRVDVIATSALEFITDNVQDCLADAIEERNKRIAGALAVFSSLGG